MTKFDLSSTTIEKGIDAARDFLNKLAVPAIEEVGLLVRDSVALWRFKNQVRVLNKAKEYCSANGIEPSPISLKLLCPLLESASLEQEEEMQNRWAILLSNLADSEQNIQNQVFPYILGQISAGEFTFLEHVYADLLVNRAESAATLSEFTATRAAVEARFAEQIAGLDRKLETLDHWAGDRWKVQGEKRELEERLRTFRFQESALRHRLTAPAIIPEAELREFELSNIVRLGLVRAYYESYANDQTLEIPVEDHRHGYVTVDFTVDLRSESGHYLTQLGEMFLSACTQKGDQKKRESQASTGT